MHTKPWVRARASKEYWQNMKPAGEEQFSFQTVPFAYQMPFFKKCLFLFGHRLGGGRGVNSCLDRLGFFFHHVLMSIFCCFLFVRVQKGPSCVLIRLCESLFFVFLYMCVSMPGGRPFCPAMAKPDNWGVTAGDKMLEQKI